MEERKLIICQGIQASGKSTWAKAWAAEQPERRVRFNNDDIRNMLGPYWIPTREKLVGKMYRNFLHEAMAYGYDIVIDNMNLNPKTVEELTIQVRINNENPERKFDYTFEFKKFYTPLKECIRRDALRETPIGSTVIRSTYNRYREYLLKSQAEEYISQLVQPVAGRPKAIIVDIDSTVALNVEGRPFYGVGAAEGMATDMVIEPVANLVRMYAKNGYQILFVTGRDSTEDVTNATHLWLKNNSIPYNKVYMRPVGSRIAGPECKRIIYRENIKDNYNVELVLEDSNSCVAMWREEGLICLQPNDGAF